MGFWQSALIKTGDPPSDSIGLECYREVWSPLVNQCHSIPLMPLTPASHVYRTQLASTIEHVNYGLISHSDSRAVHPEMSSITNMELYQRLVSGKISSIDKHIG